jgi:hypothetical protein
MLELEIPRLDQGIRQEFSSIIRHMEDVPFITFRNSLAEIGQFIQKVRSELRNKRDEPTEPKILAITLEDALPIYLEAFEYFTSFYDEASNVLLAFKDIRRLYAVYRLWKPGIMTIGDLAEFTGQKENIASNAIRKLEDWKILARETRGIYGRGQLGHLAMNLFAIMVVLWRHAKDQFYDLSVEHIAEPVGKVITFNECLTETLEQLPVLTTIRRPIVVEKPPDELFYLNPDALSVKFDIAIDSFLDVANTRPSLVNPNIDSLFQEIRLVDARTKIRNAFDAALGYDGLIFTRKSSKYHFVSLQFPFGQS